MRGETLSCLLNGQRQETSRDMPDLKKITGPPSAKKEQGMNMNASFRKILDLSSGGSHNAGIKPITFVGQVIAGCTYPRILQGVDLPPDARLRAQKLLSHFDGGSIGGVVSANNRAVEFINDLSGFSCQSVQSGIFIYPHLTLPQSALTHSQSVGLLYSRRLLEDQGVCVGFSEDHTHSQSCCHLRLCVLMPSDELEEALRRLRCFHFQFLKEYCDTGETFNEPQQSV